MVNKDGDKPDLPLDEDAPDPEEISTKVCQYCSIQSQTTGDFCTHCGTPYIQEYRRRGPSKGIIVGVLLLLLAASGITGVVLKSRHDEGVGREKLAAAMKDAANQNERNRRAEYVKSLEDAILKFTKAEVKKRVLDGPITSVACTPTAGGSTDDLTALTGTFQCIAVNKTNADGSASGYRITGTINYTDGSLSWHLGG